MKYLCKLSEAIEEFEKWAAAKLSKSTTDKYRLQLRRAAEHFGPIILEELTPAMVEIWSPKTHPRSALQRLCSWANLQARLIPDNPLKGMSRPSDGERRRVLVRLERVKLRRGSRRHFRRLLLCVEETFCRPGEARGFQWRQIRTAGNGDWTPAQLAGGECFFLLANFKAIGQRGDRRRTRCIPISKRLGRLLVRLWGSGRPPAEEIFRNSNGRPWTVNAVRCRFRRLRVRLGLVADQAGEKIVAYSLRHTGATAAVRAGIRDFALAELLGHASTRTTARYVHLQPDDLRGLFDRVRASEREKRTPTIAPNRSKPPQTGF